MILTACDNCGKETDIEALVWWRDVNLYCPRCVDEQLAVVVDQPTKAEPTTNTPTSYPAFPVYVWYKNHTPLHISTDIFSPEKWKLSQGKDWWFKAVTNIVVKFFVTEDNANLAKDRLAFVCQPLYGDEPALTDEKLDAEPVLEMESSGEKLDEILHIRVSHDIWKKLMVKATEHGVPRTHYARHLLYDALRQPAA